MSKKIIYFMWCLSFSFYRLSHSRMSLWKKHGQTKRGLWKTFAGIKWNINHNGVKSFLKEWSHFLYRAPAFSQEFHETIFIIKVSACVCLYVNNTKTLSNSPVLKLLASQRYLWFSYGLGRGGNKANWSNIFEQKRQFFFLKYFIQSNLVIRNG